MLHSDVLADMNFHLNQIEKGKSLANSSFDIDDKPVCVSLLLPFKIELSKRPEQKANI